MKRLPPDRQSRYYALWEEQEKRRKKERCRRIILMGVLGVLCAMFTACVISLSLYFIRQGRQSTLQGLWEYDVVTAYQFDGKGKGSLNVSDKKYPFLYQTEGNVLSLDFEEKKLQDIKYQFSVENEILVLINDATGQTLSLGRPE